LFSSAVFFLLCDRILWTSYTWNISSICISFSRYTTSSYCTLHLVCRLWCVEQRQPSSMTFIGDLLHRVNVLPAGYFRLVTIYAYIIVLITVYRRTVQFNFKFSLQTAFEWFQEVIFFSNDMNRFADPFSMRLP